MSSAATPNDVPENLQETPDLAKSHRNLKDLAEGESHDELDGKLLKKSIAQGYGFLVWLDKSNELKYEIRIRDYPGGDWPEDMAEFESLLSPLESATVHHLNERHVVQFRTLMGNAVGIMLEGGGLRFARRSLNQAKKFYIERTGEIFRFRYLGSSMLIGLAFLGAMICFDQFSCVSLVDETKGLAWLLLISCLGCIGAFVSVALRLENIQVSTVAPFRLLFLEALSRNLVGMIGAALLVAAYREQLILAPLQQINSGPFLEGVLAVAGGLSERVIPSLAKVLVEKSPLDEDPAEVSSG